jgi:hypothetical protein
MSFFNLQFSPMNRPYSTTKNMPKIAELKLSSCGLEVSDFRKNCDCGVAVAEQHFFKKCGIAIAEVLPSNCGVVIADSKKSSACPPLPISRQTSSFLQAAVAGPILGIDFLRKFKVKVVPETSHVLFAYTLVCLVLYQTQFHFSLG